MRHDPVRRRDDDVSELARGEEVDDPLLELVEADVEPRTDDAALVQSPGQFDDDLVGAVVVDDLELADVACILFLV